MKKIMAVMMAVLMLCVLTGCAQKQEEPNGIMEAVGMAYEGINRKDNATLRREGEGDRSNVIQVDMVSDTGTLMRPFIVMEQGLAFYKIKHSEEDFVSVLSYVMNLLVQIQQSEEDARAPKLMVEERLYDEKTLGDLGFMNMGYVADPQQLCEIIFVGLIDADEGTLIHDEVYAFCRFGMMNAHGESAGMNAMIADQNAVYAIAQRVHQTCRLPAGVEAWMLRKLGL